MVIACGGGILRRRAGRRPGACLRNLLLPVFSSLYAVPIVILYPIFTAWFGIGSESKIAFAGVYGFFPVMLSTAAGIQTIDPQLPARRAQHGRDACRSRSPASSSRPRSRPCSSGLRLGGALAIIGVVVSEMLTAAAGIGYLVTHIPHRARQPARVRRHPDDPGSAVDRLRRRILVSRAGPRSADRRRAACETAAAGFASACCCSRRRR